jgi:hypothetical protein
MSGLSLRFGDGVPSSQDQTRVHFNDLRFLPLPALQGVARAPRRAVAGQVSVRAPALLSLHNPVSRIRLRVGIPVSA